MWSVSASISVAHLSFKKHFMIEFVIEYMVLHKENGLTGIHVKKRLYLVLNDIY